MFARRVLTCFFLQLASIALSITVFVSNGTSYLWTESAVTISFLLIPRESSTSLILRCRPLLHVLTGMMSYIIVNFVYDRFAFLLALNTATSNGFGQIVSYLSMMYFFENPSTTYIGAHHEISLFFFFACFVESVCSSIPGSYGFHKLLGDPFSGVMVRYLIGHVSGNINLLYVYFVYTFYPHGSLKYKKYKGNMNPILFPVIGAILLSFLFSLQDYGVFPFASISCAYALVMVTSLHTDRRISAMLEFVVSSIIVLTACAGRGPFYYLQKDNSFESIVISTQIAASTSTIISAYMGFSSHEFREIQDRTVKANDAMSSLIETQTVILHRVGHDINNNNAIIQGLTNDILTDKSCLPMNVHSRVESVQILTMVTSGMIREMLESGEGKGTLMEIATYNLGKELPIHVGFASLLIKSSTKNIVPRIFVGNGNMNVLTDISCLHCILCNIIGNAVKYTQEGYIDISLENRCNSTVIVRISDTGIGIAAQDLPNIFDVSYRCENGKKFATGTGIGLSSVKHFCDRITASIEVDSPGVGLGSSFTLTFPVAPSGSGTESLELKFDEDFIYGTDHTAIVIDDSKIIVGLLTRFLEEMGVSVTALLSVKSFLDEMKSDSFVSPDFVITDMVIGDDNGLSLVKDMRLGKYARWGLHFDTPCIVCSGSPIDVSNLPSPKTEFLLKPFTKKGIKRLVEGLKLKGINLERERMSSKVSAA